MVTSQDAFFVSTNEGKSFRVVTDTITIKVPSEKVNWAYSVSEDVTPAEGGAPRCGDRVFKAAKGSLVALPRNIPHSFQNTGNTSGKTLLILIPGGMEKVFEELDKLPPGPPNLEKSMLSLRNMESSFFSSNRRYLPKHWH
jgi:hypothetical protein